MSWRSSFLFVLCTLAACTRVALAGGGGEEDPRSQRLEQAIEARWARQGRGAIPELVQVMCGRRLPSMSSEAAERLIDLGLPSVPSLYAHDASRCLFDQKRWVLGRIYCGLFPYLVDFEAISPASKAALDGWGRFIADPRHQRHSDAAGALRKVLDRAGDSCGRSLAPALVPRLTPLLAGKTLDDDDETAALVVRLLGHAGGRSEVATLESAYERAGPKLRLEIVKALGRAGKAAASSMELVFGFFQSPTASPEARRAALAALVAFEQPLAETKVKVVLFFLEQRLEVLSHCRPPPDCDSDHQRGLGLLGDEWDFKEEEAVEQSVLVLRKNASSAHSPIIPALFKVILSPVRHRIRTNAAETLEAVRRAALTPAERACAKDMARQPVRLCPAEVVANGGPAAGIHERAPIPASCDRLREPCGNCPRGTACNRQLEVPRCEATRPDRGLARSGGDRSRGCSCQAAGAPDGAEPLFLGLGLALGFALALRRRSRQPGGRAPLALPRGCGSVRSDLAAAPASLVTVVAQRRSHSAGHSDRWRRGDQRRRARTPSQPPSSSAKCAVVGSEGETPAR